MGSNFGASQELLVVKNPPANARDIKRCGFDPWVGKIPWRWAWQPTPVFLPRKSFVDRGAWQATAHRVAKSQTTQLKQLSTLVTADGDYSHEIKRHLLLGRKVIINLDSILKSKDITLWTKVHLVKAMFFPVVMYRCESWTIKKAERQTADAFELWCCRRLLRVPWTARRSNQSILKEISPEYSLEGLIVKLKLQYFGPPDMKNWLIGKDPDARKHWRQEEKGTTEDEMARWHYQLHGYEFE